MNGLDPDHPILDKPFTWDLLEITYRRESSDDWQWYIEILFVRAGETRRLRFYNPREFEWIPSVLPNAFGMRILDVSRRQMEGIGVRVANFEQTNAAPTFWAERVVNVDEENYRG